MNKIPCYTAMDVNLRGPRHYPLYFTFIPMRKVVLNYAMSSGTRPSHKMRPHSYQLNCKERASRKQESRRPKLAYLYKL
jgi:hypothetical protein